MAGGPKMKFKYIFPEDYNPIYISGVYGGVSPVGDIVANFFFERHALPNSQDYSLLDKGILGELIDNEPKDLANSMVRVINNGVILNIKTAKQLYQWLGAQIAIVESTEQEVEAQKSEEEG